MARGERRTFRKVETGVKSHGGDISSVNSVSQIPPSTLVCLCFFFSFSKTPETEALLFPTSVTKVSEACSAVVTGDFKRVGGGVV